MIEFTPVGNHTQARADAAVGIIPSFLSEHDPESVRAQLHKNYISGWSAFEGFTFNAMSLALFYPGDPPMHPIAQAELRGEIILVYPHAWVMVLQEDGSWEVARLD